MKITLIIVVLLSGLCAWGFNEPVAQEGPLIARIEGPAAVDAVGTPIAYEATLSNTGDAPVSGTLHIEVIDQWRIDVPDARMFSLAPGATQRFPFTAIVGAGTYNAWYPIHARVVFTQDGVERAAHPILLVRTNLTDTPRPALNLPWTPLALADGGRRSLSRLPMHRAFVEVFDASPVLLPVGWRGSEPHTRAGLHTPGVLALPEGRRALFMHPPWHEGRSGVLVVEFPLALPEATPSLRYRT